jgi:hypothetical protein
VAVLYQLHKLELVCEERAVLGLTGSGPGTGRCRQRASDLAVMGSRTHTGMTAPADVTNGRLTRQLPSRVRAGALRTAEAEENRSSRVPSRTPAHAGCPMLWQPSSHICHSKVFLSCAVNTNNTGPKAQIGYFFYFQKRFLLTPEEGLPRALLLDISVAQCNLSSDFLNDEIITLGFVLYCCQHSSHNCPCYRKSNEAFA